MVKKLMILLAVSLVLLAVINGFARKGAVYEKETTLFKELLGEHNVFAVSFDGKKYDVRRGEVVAKDTSDAISISAEQNLAILKIAYGGLRARIYPILDIPGTDIKELINAVDALSDFSSTLSKMYPDAGADIVALYPVNYLKTLTELEQIRRSFAESPSDKGMELYHIRLREAVQNYHGDAVAFVDFIESLEENTSAIFSEDFLDALIENSNKFQRAFGSYILCLNGDTALCENIPLPIELAKESAPETLSTIEESVRATAKALSVAPRPEVLRIQIEDALIIAQNKDKHLDETLKALLKNATSTATKAGNPPLEKFIKDFTKPNITFLLPDNLQ